MATPTATVSEFCQAAARSKLLSESEVKTLLDSWRKEQRGNDADLDGFRKFVVKKNLLTEYQAALLQRGRAEGFFIGSYKILDRIGSGQTGSVYQAAHTQSGQLVALKVLPSSKARDQRVLNRFQREGRLLTQLDHPNVVRAYQVGQTGSVYYIVMEYLDGETLDAILSRRKKVPIDEAVRIISQAFQGLEHLHEKRMVHRDLKPANLMVCPGKPSGKPDTTLESTVKILDIGLGRVIFEDDEATQDLQLTGEGALLGTPDYLAPEQARDARNADVRADIYSLGCVLYHLLSGRTPFPEKNVMTQMVKHATEKALPISQFVADVPAALVAVVERFMEKDPAARPATPSHAMELLKPFLPERTRQAAKAPVLPAYQEWLESESMMELPPSMKPGTKPITVPSAVPKPERAEAPKPKPKPTPPRSAPVSPTSPVIEEFNVELVEMPDPSAGPAEEPEPREAFDLDRRDFVMLSLGSAGILGAIGFGYALSRLLRKKEPEGSTEPNEEK